MKLQSAMLADAARVADNKLYVFGGQWDRVFTHAFPAAHAGLTVVLVIEVSYAEALTDHHLRVALMCDGKSAGAEARGLINVGHAPGTTPGSIARWPAERRSAHARRRPSRSLMLSCRTSKWPAW